MVTSGPVLTLAFLNFYLLDACSFPMLFHPNGRAKQRSAGDRRIVSQKEEVMIATFESSFSCHLRSQCLNPVTWDCRWQWHYWPSHIDILSLKKQKGSVLSVLRNILKGMCFQNIWHLLVECHIHICLALWKQEHSCKKMNKNRKKMTKLLQEWSKMYCKLLQKVLSLKSHCFYILQDKSPLGEESTWQKF